LRLDCVSTDGYRFHQIEGFVKATVMELQALEMLELRCEYSIWSERPGTVGEHHEVWVDRLNQRLGIKAKLQEVNTQGRICRWFWLAIDGRKVHWEGG